MPRPGLSESATFPFLDFDRLTCQPLSVLPNPVRVDRGDLAGCSRGRMREHRERDIEVIVGVRAPGEAPIVAHLRHAHRALHGPEVRIGKRNVHRLQDDPHGVTLLAPVSRDHVGRSGQAGGAAEFGHHLTARVAMLGAARIFRISEDVVLAAA